MPQPLVILVNATPLCRKIDGVGRYTRDFVKYLAKEHPEHTIILLGFLGDTLKALDLLTFSNVTFKRLPFIRKVYSFLYSRFIRIPVDPFIPHSDVFISTDFVRFPYVTKTPSVIAVHDLAYIRYPETIERKNLSYLSKHIAFTMTESNTVIATSSFAKRELEKIFPGHSQIFTVSNGIDDAFWTPSNDERQNYLLAVGTIEPRKNFESLAKAYVLLPEEVQAKHPLVVVGKNGWGDEMSKQSKHITFTGYVDDDKLIDLYRKARLFVLPSIYEGFGLPILEALSTNTPIACSNIPPFKDMAGDYATYFEPTSVKDIAKVLEDVLKHAPIARKFNAKEYSWTKTIHSLDAAIEHSLRK